MHINDLLKIAVERKASDLHLKVGAHPIIRVDGDLIPLVDMKRLMQEDTIAMAFSIMSSRQKEKFKNNFEIDIAYSVPGSGGSAATSSSSAARWASSAASFPPAS
jgi:Tfp pilus assembly protein, pilus retraction ATPase PilT